MHRLQIKKKKKTRDTDTQTHTYTGLSVSGRLAVGCWLMCLYEARAQNTLDKLNPNMVARFSQKFSIVENGHQSWVHFFTTTDSLFACCCWFTDDSKNSTLVVGRTYSDSSSFLL